MIFVLLSQFLFLSSLILQLRSVNVWITGEAAWISLCSASVISTMSVVWMYGMSLKELKQSMSFYKEKMNQYKELYNGSVAKRYTEVE